MTRLVGKLAALGLAALTASCANPRKPTATESPRPNILVIVADDLGFSDLGAFGGEIETPHLDALATSGVRLTDFHAAPACSPTRSMLLSGADNHTAGVGAMAEGPGSDRTRWGYEGVLTTRVATLAERLRENGYSTIMVGKWHLGMNADQDPHARGFDRSFALLQGAHNHFGEGGFSANDNSVMGATYTDDGKPAAIPTDFYSSDYFTTKMIEKLAAAPDGKPFMAYLAFTAPHSPLQAPKHLIAKYKGRYDGGWAVLREQRLKRMKALGLIANDVTPHPLVPDAGAWDKLSPAQKAVEARKMEIYAAMVDRLDQNVGRLIDSLKRSGKLNNTLIVFTSDNGPAGETEKVFMALPGVKEHAAKADNSIDNMGAASSFVFYGSYWAQAASAPSRMHKAWMTEGGTRVAAFVNYAGFARPGAIRSAFADVMDVTPTILAATKTAQKAIVNGRQVAAIRGRSMLPYLSGQSDVVHGADEAVSFELHGHRAVRQGEWKLLRLPLPFGDDRWALYNLTNDPAELLDVGDKYPERRKEMIAAWNAFAEQTRMAPAP